ncbi:protein kinase [Terrisporobacter petrolearius]|uniref:protein kinase domain-containing protein n=1 Tax=Terrisporobacter petrolearius TaxID=1460447 RepID=UPI001D15FC9B|nr:protein kinase [Terrisporobacter petrolearius]MCC3863890.1 protein kinase [Terrisporobacter petrolearius]
MEDFRSKYTDIQLVEKDELAEVYVAINNETQQKVRIKVLRKESNHKRYIKDITEKINMLKDLKHENLIGINGIFSFVERNYIYYYIETEYFKSRSIWNKVVFSKLTYRESLNIIKQIAEGLKEFHHKSLSHENLDTENIFIDSQGLVKVDVLSYLEQKYDESGELIDEDDFDAGKEEDIYSIGIILYTLITKDVDFSSRRLKKKIKDEEIFSIIYSATTDKADYMYENLNELILDVSSYLESLPMDVEKTLDEIDSDVEEENVQEESVQEYDSKLKKRRLIKRVCACAAVFLLLVTGVKGIELLNKNKKESVKIKPTTEVVKEEPVKEEPVEPEENTEVEEVDVATDAADIQSNDEDTYQNDYYSDENTNNSNNVNNNYNNNHNSSSKNNNNHNNNNTGNNNGGNSSGSGNNTVVPPSEENNGESSKPEEGNSNTGGEEKPKPDPNPEEGNGGESGGNESDSEINSGVE